MLCMPGYWCCQKAPFRNSSNCSGHQWELHVVKLQNSSSEGIKKPGSCFFTEIHLQNMGLYSLSCPNNIDKHLVSEKAQLTGCFSRGKWDQKRVSLQITSSEIFASNKIFSIWISQFSPQRYLVGFAYIKYLCREVFSHRLVWWLLCSALHVLLVIPCTQLLKLLNSLKKTPLNI